MVSDDEKARAIAHTAISRALVISPVMNPRCDGRRVGAEHGPQCDALVTAIASALADARAEGRREMRDEAAGVVERFADQYKAQQGDARCSRILAEERQIAALQILDELRALVHLPVPNTPESSCQAEARNDGKCGAKDWFSPRRCTRPAGHDGAHDDETLPFGKAMRSKPAATDATYCICVACTSPRTDPQTACEFAIATQATTVTDAREETSKP